MKRLLKLLLVSHLLSCCVATGGGDGLDTNGQQWLATVQAITKRGQQEKPFEKIEYASPILVRSSKAEEERLIRFVKENPDIDFASYAMPSSDICREEFHGRPLLIGAIASNYTNLISALEQQDRVVSHYEYLPGTNYNLLARAFAWQAFDAMEQIARFQPDLMNATVLGEPFIFSVPSMGNKTVLARLLNTGVDVNEFRNTLGETLLDAVSRDSDWFELVRRYGGRTGGLKKHALPIKFRERKVQQYSVKSAQTYLDRIVFPSGKSIALPGFGMVEVPSTSSPVAKWQEMSGTEEYALEQELQTLGGECGGLVVFRCGEGGVYHLQPHIEPILNQLNLIGIFIVQNGTVSPYVRQRDFCPYIASSTLPEPVDDSTPNAQGWRPSAEETALTAERKYKEGNMTWDAYAEQVQRLGFLVSTDPTVGR